MYFKTFSLLFVFGIIACGSVKTKDSSNNTTTKDSIVFGEGGGFTGTVLAWTLKSNGDIDSLNTWLIPVAKIGNIGPKKAQEIISEAAKILPSVPYEKPDNMYQFIRVYHGENSGLATFTERDSAYYRLYQKLKNVVDGVAVK